LALLGRLPSAHVDGDVMQASEKPAHQDPFTRPRLNARCRLGEPTFAGMGGKEEDAPIPDLASTAIRASESEPNAGIP